MQPTMAIDCIPSPQQIFKTGRVRNGLRGRGDEIS